MKCQQWIIKFVKNKERWLNKFIYYKYLSETTAKFKMCLLCKRQVRRSSINKNNQLLEYTRVRCFASLRVNVCELMPVCVPFLYNVTNKESNERTWKQREKCRERAWDLLKWRPKLKSTSNQYRAQYTAPTIDTNCCAIHKIHVVDDYTDEDECE